MSGRMVGRQARQEWPMTADELPANDYDSFAEAYSAETELSLVNRYYERLDLHLTGDVTGRRILDAGCGSGACTTRSKTAAQRWPVWAGRSLGL